MLGAGAGQLSLLLATPILTRLYSPETFGLAASFISIVGLLSVVAGLRFEQAIPIPDSDEEARSLAQLSIALVAVTALVISVGVTVVQVSSGRVPLLAELGELFG